MLARRRRTQLNRALSKLGLCSRGVAAAWIAAGRVRVNGKPADDPGQWVELGVDRIEVAPAPNNAEGNARGWDAGETGSASVVPGNVPALGNFPVTSGAVSPASPVYLAMHKPPGYVTSRSDELGRETIYDLLPPEWAAEWIFPVGRLDRDSEGLLLLTNDGAWSDRLTDPARHVPKVYRVKLEGRPGPTDLERFRNGIELDGGLTAPAGVEPEAGGWYRVTLTEGRNRQIRRMFHALGYKVKRLVRISIGPLVLGGLPAGAVRELTSIEVEALAAAAG